MSRKAGILLNIKGKPTCYLQTFIGRVDGEDLDLTMFDSYAVYAYFMAAGEFIKSEKRCTYLTQFEESVVHEIARVDTYIYDLRENGTIWMDESTHREICFMDGGFLVKQLRSGKKVCTVLPLILHLDITDELLPYLEHLKHDSVRINVTRSSYSMSLVENYLMDPDYRPGCITLMHRYPELEHKLRDCGVKFELHKSAY